MKPAFAFSLSILALAGAASAQSPDVDQVIQSYVQKTGGGAAWSEIRSVVRTGTALPGIANLPLESAAAGAGKWAFSLKLPNGKTQSHAANGAVGWESAPAVRAMPFDQLLEESLLWDPFLPLSLPKLFPRMTLAGKDRNGEREVWVVEATPEQGKTRTLYFDVETGLLVRAGRLMYDDYRTVGKVRIPALIRYGFQTFQYADIKVDAPVEAERFIAPELPKPAAREPLPSASEVIDRYVSAIGGEAALRKLHSKSIKAGGREGNEGFEIEAIAKAPSKWRMDIRAGGQIVGSHGGEGPSAWQRKGDMVKDLTGAEQADSQSVILFDLPLRLKEAAAALTVDRKEKRNGRDVYVIDAREPVRAALRFDAETGMLESINKTAYSDYRAVDGVQTPHRLALENGHLIMQVTEVRHNVATDDAAFRRPEAGPSFEKYFQGLDGPAAVTLLRQAFGQGVTPSDGRMLYDLIVERGYKRALDIGTARGYSSLWFGMAMKKNGGRLTTIEIDPEVADEARANFRKAGLDGVIDSRMNDALIEIPAIKGAFDFVFIDTGVPLNKKFLDLLQDRMLPGGAILAHNAGNLASSQPDFLKAIQTDPRIQTEIVSTPSGGISISTFRKSAEASK